MAENINFIPANELPEAEGEEVSVLCVENGELKQKAANGLGGGFDAAISITLTNVDGNVEHSAELASGSYEAIRAKILAGESPVVKVIAREGNWHYLGSVGAIQICEDTDEDPVIWFGLFYKDSDMYWCGIETDNTMFFD